MLARVSRFLDGRQGAVAAFAATFRLIDMVDERRDFLRLTPVRGLQSTLSIDISYDNFKVTSLLPPLCVSIDISM